MNCQKTSMMRIMGVFFVLLEGKKNKEKKKMYCRKCGARMSEQDRFCPECGTEASKRKYSTG